MPGFHQTNVQEDLTALEDWQSQVANELPPGKVHRAVNQDKFKGYRRKTNFFLYGQRLQVTDSAKYLGVTFSGDLQREKHTQATATKASHSQPFDFSDATSGTVADKFVTVYSHATNWFLSSFK